MPAETDSGAKPRCQVINQTNGDRCSRPASYAPGLTGRRCRQHQHRKIRGLPVAAKPACCKRKEKAYLARDKAYRAWVEAYRAKVEAELARDEAYRAWIKADRAVGEAYRVCPHGRA